ncbi:hypothetical protein ACHAW5_010001 [Stephanodiscus triporus]|uniref:Membrane insertase YidC/Oxa/ALB C-terminal domain-containing protein n=1 Tax=Stephanodiscus triporus TaxID=2934178 RepID=A0ABD3NXX7_9STRA
MSMAVGRRCRFDYCDYCASTTAYPAAALPSASDGKRWPISSSLYLGRVGRPASSSTIGIRHSSSSSSASSTAAATTTTPTEQLSSYLPPAPEFLANATVWGATGLLLTNFHVHLHLPYWACIALTNVCVRSSMIPIAVNGARTQVRLGTVSPEVQYLVTSFTNDMSTLGRMAGRNSRGGSFVRDQLYRGRLLLIKTTMETLRGIYRMKEINPLAIFKSPALQIPVFVYFAMDLRKIIEGSDPSLAQKLVESNFLWIADLTEPDPWYGLPIATGALLYLNVEMSVGKQALSGEASSKSNIAKLLKDVFQSLAIFMPCFMAQQPSGVQLYLLTSMIFTLLQAKALRNDVVREAVGLPSINAKPRDMSDSEIVKHFLEQMSERQAAKARGGYVLGEGVHVTGANISVPRFGTKRESSIMVDEKHVDGMEGGGMTGGLKMIKIELPDHTLRSPLLVQPQMFESTRVPFLPGMTDGVFHAPKTKSAGEEQSLSMPDIPLSVMEAANRGENLQKVAVEMAPKEVLRRIEESKRKRVGPINASKLKSKWNRAKGIGKR